MDKPQDILVLDGSCVDCEKSIQTLWCPVWQVYACVWCRSKRTDRELSINLGTVSSASAIKV